MASELTPQILQCPHSTGQSARSPASALGSTGRGLCPPCTPVSAPLKEWAAVCGGRAVWGCGGAEERLRVRWGLGSVRDQSLRELRRGRVAVVHVGRLFPLRGSVG